jgi:predicted AlkP superfamily phosphohydrolase/phosphomutase
VKVLIVGLDGADWTIVDPLMAAGRMPNLLRLVNGGVPREPPLDHPMLSPVIWTSIATGVEPARHGVIDFLAPSAAGANEPVTSAARRTPALWEILSEAGVRWA